MRQEEGKAPLKAKLKYASQEERLLKWKEHFNNLLGNPPAITDEPTKNY